MRFNDKEIAHVASSAADKEGRLSYKSPGFRETYKERWFKLKGNLLFFFRLNEHGAVYQTEPVGLLVIELCRVQHEEYAELPFTFSITFANDVERRHYFGCTSKKHCDGWIQTLQECSYEYQRAQLTMLQEKIIRLTGKDPLASLSSRKNGTKVEVTDSDVFFTRVHPVSKNINMEPLDLVTF